MNVLKYLSMTALALIVPHNAYATAHVSGYVNYDGYGPIGNPLQPFDTIGPVSTVSGVSNTYKPCGNCAIHGASAGAYSNLTTGKLGAFAVVDDNNGYEYGRARAEADWSDRLQFNTSSSGSNSFIGFSFRVDGGLIAGTSSSGQGAAWSFTITPHRLDGSSPGSIFVVFANIAPNGNTVSNPSDGSPWSVVTSLTDSGFTGGVYLDPAFATYDFKADLNVSQLADYYHTAIFRFSSLPSDISFSSESGSFLSDVGSVPETSTWTMMLIGFGVIGFAARRQAGGVIHA